LNLCSYRRTFHPSGSRFLRVQRPHSSQTPVVGDGDNLSTFDGTVAQEQDRRVEILDGNQQREKQWRWKG